jgi:hypothetical protein
MKNIPEKIYLQVGDECPDDANFNDLREVSWCSTKEFNNDIEYQLSKQEPQQGWTDEGLEILKRLVELKNMKDEGFNNKQEVKDYNDGKDKAWSDARNYLESLKPKQ